MTDNNDNAAEVKPVQVVDKRSVSWFKPGQCANPKGRPAGTPEFTAELRRQLKADPSKAVSIAKKILDAADDPTRHDWVKVVTLLIERLEGKPLQTIVTNTENDAAVTFLRAASEKTLIEIKNRLTGVIAADRGKDNGD